MGGVRAGIRDDVWPAAAAASPPASAVRVDRIGGSAGGRAVGGPGMTPMMTRAVVLCAMLGAATLFLANARRTEVTVPRTTFATFPTMLADWRAVNDPPLSEDILKVLGVDDYL